MNIETRYRYNPDVKSLASDCSGGDPASADDDPVNAKRP